MYRRNELARFADTITWLSAEPALRSHEYSELYRSRLHYGLNPETVSEIEHHKIASMNVATHWLRARIPSDGASVRVVYGPREVFNAPTEFFLENWMNLFGPKRDDVMIFANEASWILFYTHYDEFEIGIRLPSAEAG